MKIAEAEAEADKIRAVSQIEITELQRRALSRFVAEESRKQKNIESILMKALPGVTEEAKPEDVEEDWLANFFDKSRLVSDEQMQTLWGKILAGEANSPGSFSKRTVNLVTSLEKSEATLFASLCNFVLFFKESGLVPTIIGALSPIYAQHGLHFGTLTHLESAGLLSFSGVGEYSLNSLRQNTVFSYGSDEFRIVFPDGPPLHVLNVGTVLFTQGGGQLYSLCSTKPIEGFIAGIKNHYKQRYRIDILGPETTQTPPVNKDTRS